MGSCLLAGRIGMVEGGLSYKVMLLNPFRSVPAGMAGIFRTKTQKGPTAVRGCGGQR